MSGLEGLVKLIHKDEGKDGVVAAALGLLKNLDGFLVLAGKDKDNAKVLLCLRGSGLAEAVFCGFKVVLTEGQDADSVHNVIVSALNLCKFFLCGCVLALLEIKSGKITDLTPDDGNHQVHPNRDWTAFVDNWSRPDKPFESVVRSAKDGKVLLRLQQQDITGMLDAGYILPEVFHAKGRDGKTDIWGNIYRPMNLDPSKKYPVVEYIYSGPHDSFVAKDFSTYERFSHLVEMGFIVVTIDGMGTDNRSKSFQDVAYRNLKDAGFPDRILWIKAAQQKYPYMDTSNMGIYGYSAGGQNALSALLFYNDFYKVSVALCGCHDNRMDKIWWNEQWMGWPIGPWYSENSNVDNAWRMKGKLFLINGEMDDNVDPASTLQVVSELVKHNKDFEQLYLPGHTHDLGSEYLKKRTFRFFYRNCMNQ